MGADRPLVTIAIPTRNRAGSYLPGTLASALRQTYPRVQIIVSDNGSIDDTATLVTQISDSRLRYYRHESTMRANDNFNFCLSRAAGDYFALLHDDDLMDDDFVEVCMRAAQERPDIGMIRTGGRLIDTDGSLLSEVPNRVHGLTTAEYFRGWFAFKTGLYHSRLFNTRRLKQIGGFQSKHLLLQDVVAEVRLVAAFDRVDVEAVKFSVRRHSGSMTASIDVADWCDECQDVLGLMCKLVLPGEADTIGREGKQFFARLSYNRANAIESTLRRLKAYETVYRKFRCLPSRYSLAQAFGGTAAYAGLRAAKRTCERLLARPAAAE